MAAHKVLVKAGCVNSATKSYAVIFITFLLK